MFRQVPRYYQHERWKLGNNNAQLIFKLKRPRPGALNVTVTVIIPEGPDYRQ